MNKVLPDKPLVVKCAFDRNSKKILFSSAQNCTYEHLRQKIAQCFQLSVLTFFIEYKDDNGETCEITTENDLTEAIQYFQAAAEEGPISSAASMLSGRSFGSRKITLRVQIQVDYDGPSLSDAGSVASMDDYRRPNRQRSEQSFSFGGDDLDDDAVTVSSRNTGRLSAPNSARNRGTSPLSNGRASHLSGESSWELASHPTRHPPSDLSRRPPTQNQDPFADYNQQPAPDAVFERLKQEDDSASTNYDPLASDKRGAAWLRDQHERAYRSLGVIPGSSDDSSSSSEMEDQVGDLSLKRAPTGKYYYSYRYSRGSSEASHSQETGVEESFSVDPSIEGGINGKPRPTSRQLNWVAAQQVAITINRPHPLSHRSDPSIDTIIPAEFLQDIPPTPPGEEDITGCSECGEKLDSMKYVCSTCGEKDPGFYLQSSSHKGRLFTYPPSVHSQVYASPLSPTFSSSSKTFVGNQSTYSRRKPLPPAPSMNGSSSTLAPSPKRGNSESGYELCHNCIEIAGVTHAIEAIVEPGSSPTASNTSSSASLEDAALQWRRAAPKQKGQLRHAYLEKMWGHGGWTDVVQSEADTEDCSTCGVTATLQKLYKCASCPRHYLCRACYSQVHDLHPSHAFLVLPDKLSRSMSDSEINLLDHSEEQSMVHPGVKCAHCYLEIVGARFHCAECDSIDICSNCESAGLPGNIDSADGGHISSHILIKIPFPLPNNKVQSVSRKAMTLWTRDPANVNRVNNSKAKSEISSYARTVVGSGTIREEHGINCDACRKPICGVRYQCANCPAPQWGYNLCSNCEEASYRVHDSLHAFFKLPRRVNRPIQSNFPMIPVIYKMPAGPSPAAYDVRDPTGYLRSIVHPAAVCDRCVTRIQGAWFHCAHCGKDLCSSCESVDTHDDTHVFLVFKALIDMQKLRVMVEMDNPENSLPVISYPVYNSS
ncbi:hypothetical protein BT96DRAFT_965525 [Gymnopus androsaceus JB14]|uniref:ZZ-type domain-containing protein n=1 Tax=Gymnopus androsaceus JB14 TaxID=1447944 RepID=A0A6A4HSD5_9AGAR|nr:hypothetical protein BT96DRAFT_965525 [Gymnopus androsaceus JB14]